MVVHVSLFLPLSGHRATTTPARNQAGERVLVLRVLRAIGLFEHDLHRIEEDPRHERFVTAAIKLPVPLEVAHVDRISQTVSIRRVYGRF